MQVNDIMKTKYRAIKIWLKCPRCGKERWVFRLKTEKKSFTGLCRQCHASDFIAMIRNKPKKEHLNNSSGKRTGNNKRMKGVVFVKLEPEHPFYCMADKLRHRVKKSRLVVAEYLGRPLRSNEEVHHVNLNHCDDRIENLALFFSKSAHSKSHWLINGKKVYTSIP